MQVSAVIGQRDVRGRRPDRWHAGYRGSGHAEDEGDHHPYTDPPTSPHPRAQGRPGEATTRRDPRRDRSRPMGNIGHVGRRCADRVGATRRAESPFRPRFPRRGSVGRWTRADPWPGPSEGARPIGCVPRAEVTGSAGTARRARGTGPAGRRKTGRPQRAGNAPVGPRPHSRACPGQTGSRIRPLAIRSGDAGLVPTELGQTGRAGFGRAGDRRN